MIRNYIAPFQIVQVTDLPSIYKFRNKIN